MNISRKEFGFMTFSEFYSEWEEYKILTIPDYVKEDLKDYDEQVIPSEVI